jgi:Holliday junction resolvase RusA-like endonuclease
LNLFHSGKELFDRFRISLESRIIFTDYCSDLLFVYGDKIKFTSKALIFAYPKSGFENIQDDWLEVRHLEFHPWQNIMMLENVKGDTIIEEFRETEICEWLSAVNDPQLDYPYVNVREGNIAFIIVGKPRSARSKGGKIEFRQKVQSKKEEIRRVYQWPFSGNVEMKVDIFLENVHGNDRPDIDRLSTLISDAFQGIAYVDDKQIRDLRPRIIDVSSAFRTLECRTEPMDIFSLDDIPLGSVFPLAMGIRNYYVVRIMYYN